MIRWPADEANATDGVKCCSRNAPRWAAIMTENGIGIGAGSGIGIVLVVAPSDTTRWPEANTSIARIGRSRRL